MTQQDYNSQDQIPVQDTVDGNIGEFVRRNRIRSDSIHSEFTDQHQSELNNSYLGLQYLDTLQGPKQFDMNNFCQNDSDFSWRWFADDQTPLNERSQFKVEGEKESHSESQKKELRECFGEIIVKEETLQEMASSSSQVPKTLNYNISSTKSTEPTESTQIIQRSTNFITGGSIPSINKKPIVNPFMIQFTLLNKNRIFSKESLVQEDFNEKHFRGQGKSKKIFRHCHANCRQKKCQHCKNANGPSGRDKECKEDRNNTRGRKREDSSSEEDEDNKKKEKFYQQIHKKYN